jgi:hypothetical protein
MFPLPLSLFSIYTEHDCPHKNRKEEKNGYPRGRYAQRCLTLIRSIVKNVTYPVEKLLTMTVLVFCSAATCDNLTVRQMPSRTRQVLLGLVMRPELCRRNCELTVQLLAPWRRHRRRQCNDMR